MLLLLLMGPPCCGKSSYAHSLRQQSPSSVHLVSIDELYDAEVQLQPRPAMHSPHSAFPYPFSPTAWHHSRAQALARTAQLLDALSRSPSPSPAPPPPPAPVVVVVDDVFHFRSMRAPYYRLCRQRQIPFAQLLIDEPLSTCLTRLTARASSAGCPSPAHAALTAEVVASLHVGFQRPTAHEEKFTLTMSTSTSLPSLSSLLSTLRSSAFIPALLPPLPSPPSAPFLQSDLHVLDISLRRLISAHIAAHPSSSSPSSSSSSSPAALNALRRQVLLDAKHPHTLTHSLLHRDEDDTSAPASVECIGDKGAAAEYEVQRRLQPVLEYFTRLLLQAA